MSDFERVRDSFVAQWGALGTQWGINRTMAMIHAYLMVSPGPRDTEEIMGVLRVSRGNANTNLRELVDWGLIRKVVRPGERREFFEAEKDTWRMFCTIARERKRRETEPAQQLLRAYAKDAARFEGDEAGEFRRQLSALGDFVETSNRIVERMATEKRGRVMPKLLKILKLA